MKKKKPLSPVQKFLALSDSQKDAEVAAFEDGTDSTEWRPLTATQKKQWARVKRKMGRPPVGQGSKVVAVTIERGLLKQVDQFVKAHSMKRAEMIAEGLKMVLAARAG